MRIKPPMKFMGVGLLVSIVLYSSGCGGGGSTQVPVGDRTMQVGPLITRVVGTAQPPVTSIGRGVAVTGLAGADISSLTLADPLSVGNESKIAFTRDGSLWTMNADGSNLVNVNPSGHFVLEPAWSPDGKKIVFAGNSSTTVGVFVMNADGTGTPVELTGMPGGFPNRATWSPDGTKIAFTRDPPGAFTNGQLWVMNADGSGLTNITNDPGQRDFSPTWSPDSTRLAFNRFQDIYSRKADGSDAAIKVVSDGTNPAWSPDGTKILFRRYSNGHTYLANADGTAATKVVDEGFRAAWSPDGQKILVVQSGDIYIANPDGSGQVNLTNSPGSENSPAWWPFSPRRTLIGSGGVLGTNAAGFIVGQQGDLMTSIVAFDAATRANVRVAAQSAPETSGPNVIFSVTAGDSLTSLAYMNGILSSPVRVIGAGGATSAASGALVSFNATTGSVSSVIPYNANRSAAPSPTRQSDTLTVRGTFIGVWDEAGKNLAPNGAREVRIDGSTGKLLGFN